MDFNDIYRFILFQFIIDITVLADYFSNEFCFGYGGNNLPEIECNNATSFPIDLPLTVGTLVFNCAPMKSNKEIKFNEVDKYQMLTKIVIRNCKVTDFPEKLFSKNRYLQSVTFENLPLRRLRNVFYSITKIIELRLINLLHLEHISLGLLRHQMFFSRLYLDRVAVLPQMLNSVLKPVRRKIRELFWKNSLTQKGVGLKLPINLLSSLRLGVLTLQGLKLINWDFMYHVQARKLILSHSSIVNKLPFHLMNYTQLAYQTQYLDLESIGLFGVFPYSSSVIVPFKYLNYLSLKANNISSLQNNIHFMFPQLNLLDLSGNQIVVLPVGLENLFFRVHFLKLEGNPLHCNCQLRWLSSRYKQKIMDHPKCKYGLRANMKLDDRIEVDRLEQVDEDDNIIKSSTSDSSKYSLKNTYFSRLTTDSLICIPPRSPVLQVLQDKSHRSRLVRGTAGKDKRFNKTTEYTLVLSETELDGRIRLSCETEGDPPPTLTWSNQDGIVLTQHKPIPPTNPSPQHKYSLHNRIIMEISSSSETSSASDNKESVGEGRIKNEEGKMSYQGQKQTPVYFCMASNIEGVSYAQLNVIKQPPLAHKSKQLIRIGNAKKNSSNMLKNWRCIIFLDLFLYGTIVINILLIL